MMYHVALLDFSIQRGYLFTPLRSKYFLQKVAERSELEHNVIDNIHEEIESRCKKGE